MTAREEIMLGNEGYKFRDVINNLDEEDILDTMRDYAKSKCQELLEIVAEKAEVSFNRFGEEYVDKDSILNAVDLDSFIV